MPRQRNTKVNALRPASDVWTAIAHDLRQPVQAVALLARAVATEPGQSDLGQRLQLLALTIDGMIEAMSEIAAFEQGTRLPAPRGVDLARAVNEAITRHALVLAAASRTVRVARFEADVHCDPRLLAMVIDGLLLFAIKHASEAEIVVGVRRPLRSVVLDIEYAGADPETAFKRQAFIDMRPVPSAPTEPVFGLGLMLAERVATLMGARLEHGRPRSGGRRLSLRLGLAGG